MGRYTINELERVSGVKAHTIRIWEKRYGLLSPKRTETNIRYYDNVQLKKLLNISLLLESGRKISYIGNLKSQEILDEVKSLKNLIPSDENSYFNLMAKELLGQVIDYDKSGFEKSFDSCILRFGVQAAVEKVLYPLLNEMGMLWLAEDVNPAQEHFLSNLVRQKLFAAIDGLRPADSTQKAILFLPENEDHEIGLLYANYLLMKSGVQTIYLGQRLPFENLKQIVHSVKPTHLFFSVTSPIPIEEFQGYLKLMAKTFPDAKILLFGNEAIWSMCKLPKNIKVLGSPADISQIGN